MEVFLGGFPSATKVRLWGCVQWKPMGSRSLGQIASGQIDSDATPIRPSAQSCRSQFLDAFSLHKSCERKLSQHIWHGCMGVNGRSHTETSAPNAFEVQRGKATPSKGQKQLTKPAPDFDNTNSELLHSAPPNQLRAFSAPGP